MDTADSVFGGLVFISAALWSVILALPWRPWLNREVLRTVSGGHFYDLDDVTVVIPARDEAEVIGQTLAALKNQGSGLRVVLVDDGSTDGTGEAAGRVEGLALTVLRNESLPPGWSGKLWALKQGVARVGTEYTVLLDADIVLQPGVLGTLREKMRCDGIQFASLMASLRMENFWERLLMPAFVYFFKMLYPFALANSPDRRFAAAAGGCIMLETRLLERIGGFAAIHGALIDDCTLAKKVKATGARTWIGLSRSVVSLRRYDTLADVWDMVARTAFTQLRYSVWLLALCTLLMLILFWLPAAGLFASGYGVTLAAGWAVLLMAGTYIPTLRFYGRSAAWGLLMPVVAGAYLAMTWSSALRYRRGERSRWKGRIYSSEEEAG
ncbi:glycosyltransferase [Methylococcus mesophilus]|uniref:glycosyltransferase n=1 Tax=Methylococcus mesophilus TaxID=2993564 RepID=UPI00224B7FE5|nr:glycosyltransferase [Methylococcus mesophilus]UZR27493.1 glycosyltransferase [Methylococcus mesophilus]